MTAKELGKCALMIQSWTEEDLRLQALSDEMRDWMATQPADCLEPNEVQSRWMRYRQDLCDHFENEDRVFAELNVPEISEEVSAVRRQSSRDHLHILSRVDRFIAQLAAADCANDWSALLIESNLLFDVVEQHEEQESDSLRILTAMVSC